MHVRACLGMALNDVCTRHDPEYAPGELGQARHNNLGVVEAHSVSTMPRVPGPDKGPAGARRD